MFSSTFLFFSQDACCVVDQPRWCLVCGDRGLGCHCQGVPRVTSLTVTRSACVKKVAARSIGSDSMRSQRSVFDFPPVYSPLWVRTGCGVIPNPVDYLSHPAAQSKDTRDWCAARFGISTICSHFLNKMQYIRKSVLRMAQEWQTNAIKTARPREARRSGSFINLPLS